jgi:hypothetical protein
LIIIGIDPHKSTHTANAVDVATNRPSTLFKDPNLTSPRFGSASLTLFSNSRPATRRCGFSEPAACRDRKLAD